ncbi:MAG: AarF/UbiB family protein [Pyrinomonadaceae bacterium]
MNIKIENLKRYKEVVWLLVKYGRSDIVKQAGLHGALEKEPEFSEEEVKNADQFAADLEKLGGTYIKLGQLLSTRADLLPAAYLKALERLQDDIEPFAFEEVERIVSEEIGARVSRIFSEFEEKPLAAASLGQVHFARLRSGQPVVVKVQRPGVREKVVLDLETLEDVAVILDEHTEFGKRYDFQRNLRQLRKSLLQELDYRREAANLIHLAENLSEFKNIVIPFPVDDLTTSHVLTMEYIAGRKITDLSPLALTEIDGRDLAGDLFHAYLKQILVDGFFHADPHPGNIYLTESGRIALLDLGMVGRLSGGFRDKLTALLLAVSEGRGEEAANTAIKMGEPRRHFDQREFMRRVGDLVETEHNAGGEEIDAGSIVLEITRISAECGFRLPPEFTMIAKTMLNLDKVVYTLDPDFNPNRSIKRHAAELLRERITQSLSTDTFLGSAIEIKEFVQKLPTRVNNILDVIGKNELELKVDAIDEKTLMVGFQKIANRITMGLILAALIIGASMLMRVESSFRIFGYPGLPLIFFLGAAVGGLVLIYNILFQDEGDHFNKNGD